MTTSRPVTDADIDQAPELDAAWFAQARPGREVLPARVLAAAKRKPGRPAGDNNKEPTTIRFDRDVLDALRATGPGWQTRVNEVMREWVSTHARP
jgi:uncharacterized protein (DUF4415 family)